MSGSPRPLSLARPSNPQARGAGPQAYQLAVEHERKCWDALHSLKRTDVRYPQALLQWRAAADGIGVAAECWGDARQRL